MSFFMDHLLDISYWKTKKYLFNIPLLHYFKIYCLLVVLFPLIDLYTIALKSPYVEAPKIAGTQNNFNFPVPTAPPGALRHSWAWCAATTWRIKYIDYFSNYSIAAFRGIILFTVFLLGEVNAARAGQGWCNIYSWQKISIESTNKVYTIWGKIVMI